MIFDAISSFVPTPEAFAAAQVTLARLHGYLDHFAPAAVNGKDQETIEREAADAGRKLCPTPEQFFAMLDASDVDRAVVYNEIYSTSLGVRTAANDEVATFVAKAPDRLIGLGGVDPWTDDPGREVERGVRELDLRGFVISPFKQKLLPHDARIARVFARLEALGVPLYIRSGVNWWYDVPYDIGHPRYIDAIASAFPKLRIVALHAGWPWVMDMMIVTWRHPNVYVDISAHRPRHFTITASGLEPLLHDGNRMLSHRVLFGSTWTLLGTTIAELAKEVRDLPLKDSVIEAWLGGNARRLFGVA